MTHYNLVYKFIPMPQAMKILDAKAAVDKERKKLETIPARHLDKAKGTKEVILEAQKEKTKVHFATLMDFCHLKIAELEPKHQKIQRTSRAPRWHCEKTTQVHTQYLQNKDRQLRKVAAAKVMDVVARLPDCVGQATDAVSACTQVKMEDAPRVLNIPKSECPEKWTRRPRHEWPNHG